jgi:hypothetical protein
MRRHTEEMRRHDELRRWERLASRMGTLQAPKTDRLVKPRSKGPGWPFNHPVFKAAVEIIREKTKGTDLPSNAEIRHELQTRGVVRKLTNGRYRYSDARASITQRTLQTLVSEALRHYRTSRSAP